ncbi:NUDIX domain-containing protein [Rhizobium tubonense]|uniref:NUDIX domain-containing protein n=1 Tax=Rhizobium tubonense TaxID=484088 RepID=UPI0018A8403F|nr:NUDIX domain-containing protein [Rhizobium tubonense]
MTTPACAAHQNVHRKTEIVAICQISERRLVQRVIYGERKYALGREAMDREATVARLEKALRDAETLDSWNKQGEAFRSLRDDIEATILELRTAHDNPATVVVVMAEVNDGLLMIRRALPDGFGKLALPGGFQGRNETWQEAGVREVHEETGVVLDPRKLILQAVESVEGNINLLFAFHTAKIVWGSFVRDTKEVLSVHIQTEAVECAFETHTKHVRRYFSYLRRLVSSAS